MACPHALWPQPQHATCGSTPLALAATFSVGLATGSQGAGDATLEAAMRRCEQAARARFVQYTRGVDAEPSDPRAARLARLVLPPRSHQPALLDELIGRMSLKEKVGQCFQINWKNMRPTTGAVASAMSKVMPKRVSSMMMFKNDTRVCRVRPSLPRSVRRKGRGFSLRFCFAFPEC